MLGSWFMLPGIDYFAKANSEGNSESEGSERNRSTPRESTNSLNADRERVRAFHRRCCPARQGTKRNSEDHRKEESLDSVFHRRANRRQNKPPETME